MSLLIPGKLYALIDKPKYIWYINASKILYWQKIKGCYHNGEAIETNCKNLMHVDINIREGAFIFLHKCKQIRMDSRPPFDNIEYFLNDWKMI